MARTWEKIDHFTNKPYKREKMGFYIVDYISDDYRISELSDGTRELTKGDKILGRFRTVKAAKAFVESI